MEYPEKLPAGVWIALDSDSLEFIQKIVNADLGKTADDLNPVIGGAPDVTRIEVVYQWESSKGRFHVAAIFYEYGAADVFLDAIRRKFSASRFRRVTLFGGRFSACCDYDSLRVSLAVETT